jgi:cell division protein FtsB
MVIVVCYSSRTNIGQKMKKQFFIILFISAHLFFIGFQIDKQTRLVKLSYTKQTYEQQLQNLKTKKQALINHLHALQNHQKIKTFASTTLGMRPLFLKNIASLPKKEALSHEGS